MHARSVAWPYAPWLRTLLLTLWIAFLPLHQATASQPEDDDNFPPILLIDQAQALVTVQGNAELSLVALPYHWDRQQPGSLVKPVLRWLLVCPKSLLHPTPHCCLS